MKSVVICGSSRFKKEALEFAKELEAKGVIVYKPFHANVNEILKLDSEIQEYAFCGLSLHHLNYIRKADAVFIFNQNGYIGNSTMLEIGASFALVKPIYSLEKYDADKSIAVLIDAVAKTPDELIKKLI
ncbi:MAG: hypothetical protein WC376_02410 [Candidatus Nanoarchaeia archaeon]